MRQILVHGLGQNSSSWDRTLSGLAGHCEVSCPDIAELVHGNECTYETLYRAFSSYCQESSGPVKLCGLSLGAVLALNFAVDHPERVSSLILIAPQYKMPKMLLRFQNIVFKFMPDSAFQGTGFDKKAMIKLTGSMMDLDFSQKLKDISCPTLVLCGEKDNANKGACEKAAKFIPNARMGLIENSGHEVNVDAPEKLAALINSFFNQQ